MIDINDLKYNTLEKALVKAGEERIIDENVINSLYDRLEETSEKLCFDPHIQYNEFKSFFKIVYEYFKFHMTDEEFNKLSEIYLNLIMADSNDKYNTDINWYIDKLWYYCYGYNNENLKFRIREEILYIQKKLMIYFNIKENFKENIKRKLFVKYITR